MFQAEVADKKSAANEVLDDLFDSIEKFATSKMVNDKKKISDKQEGRKMKY